MREVPHRLASPRNFMREIAASIWWPRTVLGSSTCVTLTPLTGGYKLAGVIGVEPSLSASKADVLCRYTTPQSEQRMSRRVTGLLTQRYPKRSNPHATQLLWSP